MNLAVINGGPKQREDERVPELMRREDLERSVALFPGASDQVRESLESEQQYLTRCLEEQSGEFILVGWKVGADSDLEWQRQENAAIGAADFIPPEGLDVRVRMADGRRLPQ